MSRFILCSKWDDALTPYRFWQWKILTKEKMDDLNGNRPYRTKAWHPYEGSPSLIPKSMIDEISAFEKTIGYAIERPLMSGDEKIIIGTNQ